MAVPGQSRPSRGDRWREAAVVRNRLYDGLLGKFNGATKIVGLRVNLRSDKNRTYDRDGIGLTKEQIRNIIPCRP